MVLSKLTLLVGIATTASALVTPAELGGFQHPLVPSSSSNNQDTTDRDFFKCHLPPAVDPSRDGLPSASHLFSSPDALAKQIRRHQAIVRVPSVCYDDLGDYDDDERWKSFDELHAVLAETYPTIHKRAKLDKVNRYGLVYTVQGADESLKPTLLAAHQDVVPVADASTWTHPPFDAHFDGEWLWGRGSSDDKNSLTGLMSALEALLSIDEWKPRRTILLAFGFDEECSGFRGAGYIAKHLSKRYGNDSMAIILDEGGMGMPKIGNVRYALPAVFEKGHVDVWYELSVVGGHSSVPFPHTGIGIISEIVTALEAHPYEPKLTKENPLYQHLNCIAHYSPHEYPKINKLLRRRDLDGIARELVKQSPKSHYSIQTSQAVDYIFGGQKINAMPEKISLGVNYRVAAHNSIAEVQHNSVKLIQGVVNKYGLKVKAFEGDDSYSRYVASLDDSHAGLDRAHAEYEVDYKGTLVLYASETSQVTPTSPTTGAVWNLFSGTLQHTFANEEGPIVPVGEGMTGNTDTRHYLDLSRNIYRFTPAFEGSSEGVHTIDERVRMVDHMNLVRFYYDLIRNFDAADL